MAQQECIVCTRPAYLFCKSCANLDKTREQLDDARWYCTPLCQDIDSLSHNETCTNMVDDSELFERTKLAGEIVQELFYTFIEHTWAYNMAAVNVLTGSSGVMVEVGVMHPPRSQERPRACERFGEGWLFKFPHESFSVADEKAERALLADRHSVWAFVIMHVAVQVLFAGMLILFLHRTAY